jgi:predicted nuclease of predicted toxin-antitoxin system
MLHLVPKLPLVNEGKRRYMPWVELYIGDSEAKKFSDEYKKKARFVIDESLGIVAANVIRDAGWNAVFVTDVGLSGHPDEDLFAFAWREDRILLTHDRDFLDDRRFPPNRNPGLIVLPGASGSTEVLEIELFRVLTTIGLHRRAYLGYKIHIRDDGTWAIRNARSPSGSRNVRLLKFGRHGKIWEWEEDS